MSVPEQLRYSEEHEWVAGLDPAGQVPEDGIVTVGITAHAAEALGEIVYLELHSNEGDAVEAGEPCGEVESTKSVSDLYAPVSGEITAINSAVVDEPKVINDDPYGEGWIFKVRISGEPGDLLDATDYNKLVEEG
ncbi:MULTISPECIES: glycine cleavage system protein GcvH [Actinomadura]|uniref:Glycine cleavage system H protein n=1 Tax=Actinomadura litoris TaxID=2678616 RepID=A0A7K1KXW9_9ACTN|nr:MULTISPECIES: glycine cleavage system protein GcvH [Actinomadura]MBT2209134.1 glycine cleavage system protein GcvH [Actinomadura sp. NEAU-AAG7]MUN37050.1 glycine cleavage system protein GcvH [Actinomadura litoris]